MFYISYWGWCKLFYQQKMSFSDKITFFSSGKVFSKLSYNVPKLTIKDVVECKAGVIEVVLANIRLKVSAPIKNNSLFLQTCYSRRHQYYYYY